MDAVHEVMHLFRAMQYRVLRETPHELSHMEFKVLAYFARHPGATLSDLVLHASRDKAQIARLIAGLRTKALLEAEADPKDRRTSRVRVTAAGARVHALLEAQSHALAVRAVAGLDDAEARRLLALLDRVRRNLLDAG
ncbi:MarR family winged helix-turn-helix transcriptional regulator [Denitromonas iodatirespirans]|uniref:Winged helix DNA-binding protein n=1 Tax=Denitromonas iodatirespirans TaxID=2795389 RepID=A0A944D7K9_DENI1|nr:MarR family transcriptional regulator [Denitromonas iodatirespirans]MBT0959986.1 winged helix DNA-binding protein [Denitromonas iodatirespirans]